MAIKANTVYTVGELITEAGFDISELGKAKVLVGGISCHDANETITVQPEVKSVVVVVGKDLSEIKVSKGAMQRKFTELAKASTEAFNKEVQAKQRDLTK